MGMFQFRYIIIFKQKIALFISRVDTEISLWDYLLLIISKVILGGLFTDLVSMEIFSESGVTGLPDNLHIQQ